MSETIRRGRPPKVTDEAQNKPQHYTRISQEELAARRAKWEADRLVEEARCRLKAEYERAFGVYPYSVCPSNHDTLHFWTQVAINNLLTEHATVREIDAVTAVLREAPSNSIFSDSSAEELERRVKAALVAVRAQIATEPKSPAPPAVEVVSAPKPIASETMADRARRLYSEGAKVREVAAALGCSVGKAHQLKKGMNS